MNWVLRWCIFSVHNVQKISSYEMSLDAGPTLFFESKLNLPFLAEFQFCLFTWNTLFGAFHLSHPNGLAHWPTNCSYLVQFVKHTCYFADRCHCVMFNAGAFQEPISIKSITSWWKIHYTELYLWRQCKFINTCVYVQLYSTVEINRSWERK